MDKLETKGNNPKVLEKEAQQPWVHPKSKILYFAKCKLGLLKTSKLWVVEGGRHALWIRFLIDKKEVVLDAEKTLIDIVLPSTKEESTKIQIQTVLGDYDFTLPELAQPVMKLFAKIFSLSTNNNKNYPQSLLKRHVNARHTEIVTFMIKKQGHRYSLTSEAFQLMFNDVTMTKFLITLDLEGDKKIFDETDSLINLLVKRHGNHGWTKSNIGQVIAAYLENKPRIKRETFNTLLYQEYGKPYRPILYTYDHVTDCLLTLEYRDSFKPRTLQELISHGAKIDDPTSCLRRLRICLSNHGYRLEAWDLFFLLLKNGGCFQPKLPSWDKDLISELLDDAQNWKMRTYVLNQINFIIPMIQAVAYIQRSLNNNDFFLKLFKQCGTYDYWSSTFISEPSKFPSPPSILSPSSLLSCICLPSPSF